MKKILFLFSFLILSVAIQAQSFKYNPTASATIRGYLSATDWTTFNNKFTLPSLTGGSLIFSNGTTLAQDNANIFWDDTNNRLGIGTLAPSTRLEVRTDALGTTQVTTAGLALVNETAAAAGAQQISPAIRWKGYGWKTTATAASQSVEFRADVLPVQGTSAPTGSLRFQSSINGGAFSDAMTLTSDGAITLPNASRIYVSNIYSSNYNTAINLIGLTTLNYTPTGLSGSSALSAFNVVQTWNTSGSPTLFFANVTNTASGANANLMDLQVGSTSMFKVDKAGAVTSLYQRVGSGSPEGVVTAPVGAVYHRTDGGAGTSFYVKESGTGNTGWVPK